MPRSNFSALISLFIFSLIPITAEAHPWGGLVVDNNGNIYFSFICPPVDEDHYACAVKIDSTSQLIEILKSNRSPSDIILSRSSNRNIYAAERAGSNPSYRNTLWELNGNDAKQTLLTSDQDFFHIQAFVINDNGGIFYAKENQIFFKETPDEIPKQLIESEERINLISFSPTGSLYFMAGDDIYLYTELETKLIAKDLKKSNPENLPFRGANIFFDMAIDKRDHIYLAYYGNREILRIDTSGKITTILRSEDLWSPHGVDIFDGDLYVLESTVGEGKWWKFWEEDVEIAPRIRKVDSTGTVSTIYSYSNSNKQTKK